MLLNKKYFFVSVHFIRFIQYFLILIRYRNLTIHFVFTVLLTPNSWPRMGCLLVKSLAAYPAVYGIVSKYLKVAPRSLAGLSFSRLCNSTHRIFFVGYHSGTQFQISYYLQNFLCWEDSNTYKNIIVRKIYSPLPLFSAFEPLTMVPVTS